MAKLGVLEKWLARCDIPVCSACQYGKASRRPWKKKSFKNTMEADLITKAGEVVSMDQMISHTPGLIAQMSGFLT